MSFSGVFTALITPFKDDLSLDHEAFERIIENQIEKGIDGLVILGTTGESPTIGYLEHNEIIKFAIKIANGRTQIIAGAGSNSTSEAIEYSIKAEHDGADGLLHVTPYYNKPTQKGIYEHFKAIANSTQLPIILYQIPGRTGINIDMETLEKLFLIPNIVAIKEASGNLKQAQEVIYRFPEIDVLSGNDDQNFEICKMGGSGVISVASHVIGPQIKKMIKLCRKNKFEEAQTIHEKYLDLVHTLFIETNPIPIKTLMAELGYCKEVFRLPMTTMEKSHREKLIDAWKSISSPG